jgi:hypothetical protein
MKAISVTAFVVLASLGSLQANAGGKVCAVVNTAPAQCGPVTTRIVLSGGTLAFFNIPANPTYGTSAVNAAYFSPDGFNLEGNGGGTISAYTGSVAIKAVVPVNGGVDTLFENGSVYFSPNGQNLGGGCAVSVCTMVAYSGGSVPITQIVAAGGGVDAVLAVSGRVEKAYFSPDGLNLGGGGNSVSIYNGGVAISQIVPVDSYSVVTLFSNGAAYYSPNNRSIGGGGSTISAYSGAIAIRQILKIGDSLLTQFSNNAVYLSPNGRNLGGGGSTISVANWVHATNGPFPVRDSAHGAVFNGRLYLSGGFYNSIYDQPQNAYPSYNYFDLWNTASDESGTSWNSAPVEECNGDVAFDGTSYPPCWDSFSALVVWQNQLFALGSYVFSSSDGTTWVNQASHNGGNATPAQTGPRENARALVVGGNLFYIQLEPAIDVQMQTPISSKGTPWKDLGSPSGMQPRCGPAVFTTSNGNMWIEGGRDALPDCGSSSDYTHDIWSSSDGVQWTKASKAPEWSPRQWPCVATDSAGTTWLVGGYSVDFATASRGEIRFETNLADVWYTKDGLNWKQFKTDVGSQLPDDLSLGIGPRHAPICYIDAVNNRFVVVAGKTTPQPTPNPPYNAQNPPPLPNHDSGNVSNDVRILQLPDPSVLP